MNQLRYMTRGVSFAYLFGPPRLVKREEAYKVHEGVCKALGCEDFSFQYNISDQEPRGASQQFSIKFQRKEGRGSFSIVIDSPIPAPGAPNAMGPVRLLVNYDWPQSPQHVIESIDDVTKAVFSQLDGEWQRVLAEVTIRGQCDAPGQHAPAYLKKHLFSDIPGWVESLGSPLVFASTKFKVLAVPSETPLDSPMRTLTVEVLGEDPRSLYIELTSRWPQMPDAVPPGTAPESVTARTILEEPSKYIENAIGFLQGRIEELGKEKTP